MQMSVISIKLMLVMKMSDSWGDGSRIYGCIKGKGLR